MKKIKIFFIALFFFILSCENSNDKKVIGQLIGAAVGGYVGSKIGSGVSKDIAVILGGATGYILGGKIIEILNESDKEEFNNVIEKSLNYNPDNSPESWNSKDKKDISGVVTPLNNYELKNMNCRDFKKVLKKEGEVFEEDSTACRDKNGNWVLI